ncbi:MAG: SRPBCC domain-containing protein [Nitrospirales bacterium]|nr:SRPBCC domain-containing protein [Nitrospirales bacterium]
MVDIIHRVGIKAPVSKVYAALSTVEGVAAWWTKETTGVSESGGNIEVRFLSPGGKEIGRMNMEVMELDPNKKVHWRFRSGPAEWVGTDVIFTLSQDGDYTIVLFVHKNWREANEFTSHCSMKWATFMLSLKDLVETGKGKPSPNDIKIDNWN